MKNSTSIDNLLVESLGYLSGFNIYGDIWEQYEAVTLPNLIDATQQLKIFLNHSIKNMSPVQAESELALLSKLQPIIYKLKEHIDTITDYEFQKFKNSALDFIHTFDLMEIHLEDIAHVHSSYELSIPSLSSDWDDPVNDHWDNY
ncbi:MAG: hypothetical protein U0264_15665 [Candidatus Kapaibacterium sp.]